MYYSFEIGVSRNAGNEEADRIPSFHFVVCRFSMPKRNGMPTVQHGVAEAHRVRSPASTPETRNPLAALAFCFRVSVKVSDQWVAVESASRRDSQTKYAAKLSERRLITSTASSLAVLCILALVPLRSLHSMTSAP